MLLTFNRLLPILFSSHQELNMTIRTSPVQTQHVSENFALIPLPTIWMLEVADVADFARNKILQISHPFSLSWHDSQNIFLSGLPLQFLISVFTNK